MKISVKLSPFYRETEYPVTDDEEIDAEFHDKVANAVAEVLRSSALIGFEQDVFRIEIETK